MGARKQLFLVVLMLLPSAAGAGDLFLTPKTYSLGKRMVVVAGEDRRGPYSLGSESLIAGSETVTLHGKELVRDTDYFMRYDRGEISFDYPLVSGDSAVVAFRSLPLPLKGELALNRLRFAGEGVGIVTPEHAPSSFSGPLDRGTVRVGGSKSFAVVIGSGRELKLEQALRVSVDGFLAPDVRVTARLTDENLPFQPEGRSERLEQLDEVVIAVESPSAKATLGDYDVDFRGGRFGAYRRVLKGVLGSYARGPVGVELSGGLARGEFLSVDIRGAEGKQGPYDLIASGSDRVIVAGSESVWLDGEKMTRGDQNDYVIDYNAATLLFNPSRPIMSESRISVDFQVSGDQYKRSFFTNRFHVGNEGDRFRMEGAFFQEKDDENRPEALVLTEEDLDSLAASGDRQALVPSGRAVEEGGDYDTLGGVFVYAGPGEGAFTVSFRNVGSGKGSYRKDISAEWGREIFVFAGEGAADYDPVVPLPLPASHRVVHLRAKAFPSSGVAVEGEWAWSDLDRNILSDLDDGDNRGTGAAVDMKVAPFRLGGGKRPFGRLSLSGAWRRVAANFEPLGRYRDTERDDRWMTVEERALLTSTRAEEDRVGEGEASAARGRESMWNGEGTWSGSTQGSDLVVTGRAGRLVQDLFRSARYEALASVRSGKRYRVSAQRERVKSESDGGEDGTTDGDGLIRSVSGAFRAGWFEPSVMVKRERRDFSRRDSLVGGIRSAKERYALAMESGSASADASVTFEEKDVVDSIAGRYEGWYDGVTGEISGRWRGPATVNGLFRHRTVRYAPGAASGNESSDLGRIEARHGGLGGLLQGTWTYQVSSEERRPREIRLVPAPADTSADYDSLGNFFPGEGGYNRVFVDGEPEPLIDLEASASIRIDPSRRRRGGGGKKPGRLKGGLRCDLFLSVRELSRETDRTPLLLLQPRAFQRNDTTIRGTVLFRQELRWDDRKSDGSVQLRYQREDREANDFALFRRDDLVHTVRLLGKLPLSGRFTGEVEWNRRIEKQWSNDERAVDAVSDVWEGGVVYQPTPRWRFRLPAALSRDVEGVLDETIESFRVEPEAAVNLAAAGRLDGSLSWNRFLRADVDRSRSFLRDRREGVRWNVRFAYDVSSVLRSSLAYSGENWKGESADHRFRAEMRAFF